MQTTDATVSTQTVPWLAAIVDLSRSRQALLSVAQPALGAVLASGGLPEPWRMAVGIVAASAGYLAVFSLNDILDRKADAASIDDQSIDGGFDLDTVAVRHPLARGDLSMRASLMWVGSLGLVSAVSAYALAPVCLVLFAVAVALEVAYCSLRSVTWAKTFISGAMVAVGGLAGWVAVAPLTLAAWSVFVFLFAWEIVGRNLPNDLTDVGADARVGIRTVATTFGAAVTSRSILAGSVVTVASLTFLPAPAPVRVVCALLGLVTMVAPALRLAANPDPSEAGRYFNVASLMPTLMLAAVLVSVMLGG